jgi:hypothetical protein
MRHKRFVLSILSLFVLGLGLFVFNSCEKESLEAGGNSDFEIEASDEPTLSEEVRNQVIDELAQVVAISLNEQEVREMFHDELSKQFTLDYDILYRFVADKEVSTKGGKLKYDDYLHKIAKDKGLNLSALDANYDEFKNLQISAPSFFEDWQAESFVPNVISLPVEYTENLGIVLNSYASDNSKNQTTEEEIVASKQPFLLVRQSERVDPTGMIRVDINNFVLPPGYRTLSAEQAYELANQGNLHLKSSAIGSGSSIIEIVPDEDFVQPNFIDSVKILEDYLANNPNDVNDFKSSHLKAACSSYPPQPTKVEVYPKYPYTAYIKWDANSAGGDVDFELYRKYSYTKFKTSWPFFEVVTIFGKIATIDPWSNGTSYTDRNLKSGINYEYQIAAVNSDGCKSALTYPIDCYPSWRNNNINEKIKKVYISKDCWRWCVGGLDGKIELVCRSITYDKKNDKFDWPKKGLGQKTRSNQRGKWCNYGTTLFQWDMSRHAYNYMASFYEDDGGNDKGVTINLGAKFKISDNAEASASISYTIDNKDEEMGYFEVYYYRSGDTEYSMQPKKGSAKVVVGQ